MKITFYSPLFITGGMETAVYHLAKEFIRHGHNIVFAYEIKSSLSENILKKYSEIGEVIYVNKDKKPGGVIIGKKAAIIHTDLLINCSNWSFVIKNIIAKKTIHWIHGTIIANIEKLPKDNVVVCQSNWQKERLKKSHCVVIPNIMNEHEIRLMANKVNTPLYHRDDKLDMCFLMVCRISPEKGWDRAIEFMNRPENKNSKLFVLGAPYRKEDELIVERVNKALGKKVEFLGEVANPYPFMRNADYLLSLSDFETYGLTTKEAHIIGTPVIFNRYETANDQFIKGADQWLDEYDPTHEADKINYEDDTKLIYKSWEALL